MQAWRLLPLLLPFFPGIGHGDDTVAEDIGVHQLDRLAELLTSQECQDLLSALSHPEEDILEQLERLSLENNQLDLSTRDRRDTGSDKEAQCRTALTDWLLDHGKQTYYDRLSRALQHIGRTDIAVEVGKNINQDKTLGMKRYVEDFHKHASTLDAQALQPQAGHGANVELRTLTGKQARDLSWRDLDLVVKPTAIFPYSLNLLDEAWPLFHGLLVGFVGAFLVGVPILLIIVHITREDQKRQCQFSPSSWTKRSSFKCLHRYHSPDNMAGDV